MTDVLMALKKVAEVFVNIVIADPIRPNAEERGLGVMASIIDSSSVGVAGVDAVEVSFTRSRWDGLGRLGSGSGVVVSRV